MFNPDDARFRVVIGLENHVQLKTKTKLFSPAPVTFNAPPNAAVHPIDLGYPGFMPSVNKQAVKLAVRTAHLLGMDITNQLVFDRKNYVYSDLSKGFQITQFFHPLARRGALSFKVGNELVSVVVQQLQIEEDTAKQIYVPDGILLDYNRAGIGLIEIITAPCLNSAAVACQYVRTLRQLLLFAGVSTADMSQGSLRCDVNISLNPTDTNQLGTRVEVKNLNSVNNIGRAINYEIKRQTTLLKAGEKIKMETRRFNEQTGQTELMRTKTAQIDYKFMTEPNIHPIQLDRWWLQKVIADCPLTPKQIKLTYQAKWNLLPAQTEMLMKNYQVFIFFDRFLTHYERQLSPKTVQLAVKLIFSEVVSFIKKHSVKIADTGLTLDNWATVIRSLSERQLSLHQVRQIIGQLLAGQTDLALIMTQHNPINTLSPTVLTKIVRDLVRQHQAMIAKNRERPQRINSFLMGQVMKITKGQADPNLVQTVLADLLATNSFRN